MRDVDDESAARHARTGRASSLARVPSPYVSGVVCVVSAREACLFLTAQPPPHSGRAAQGPHTAPLTASIKHRQRAPRGGGTCCPGHPGVRGRSCSLRCKPAVRERRPTGPQRREWPEEVLLSQPRISCSTRFERSSGRHATRVGCRRSSQRGFGETASTGSARARVENDQRRELGAGPCGERVASAAGGERHNVPRASRRASIGRGRALCNALGCRSFDQQAPARWSNASIHSILRSSARMRSGVASRARSLGRSLRDAYRLTRPSRARNGRRGAARCRRQACRGRPAGVAPSSSVVLSVLLTRTQPLVPPPSGATPSGATCGTAQHLGAIANIARRCAGQKAAGS